MIDPYRSSVPTQPGPPLPPARIPRRWSATTVVALVSAVCAAIIASGVTYRLLTPDATTPVPTPSADAGGLAGQGLIGAASPRPSAKPGTTAAGGIAEARPTPSGSSSPTVAGPFSVTVDNATSGRFTASSDWITSSSGARFHGADYRYARPIDANEVAWFKANIPSAGNYVVQVWYPASDQWSNAVPFVIATTTGLKGVTIDQRINGGRWLKLGTFTLPAGDADVVGVSRSSGSGGYVVADAVRITSA